jgi:hypothetical protein
MVHFVLWGVGGHVYSVVELCFTWLQAVATLNRHTLCMVSKTSRGPLRSILHFNDHFVTWVRTQSVPLFGRLTYYLLKLFT